MATTAREVAFASKPQPPGEAEDDAQPGTGDSANEVSTDVQYPEFVVAGTAHPEPSAGNLYNQLHANDDDGNGNNDIDDGRDEDFAYLEAISERERSIQASQEDQVRNFLRQQSAPGNNGTSAAFVHEKALEALSKPANGAKRKSGPALKFSKVAKISKIADKTKKRSRFSQHPAGSNPPGERSDPAAEKNELPQTVPEGINAENPPATSTTTAKSDETQGTASLGLGYDDVVSSEDESEGEGE